MVRIADYQRQNRVEMSLGAENIYVNLTGDLDGAGDSMQP